jgi:hypothetical protein
MSVDRFSAAISMQDWAANGTVAVRVLVRPNLLWLSESVTLGLARFVLGGIMIHEVRCGYCGGVFTAARSHARFCSPACRQSASRARRYMGDRRSITTEAKRARPRLHWRERDRADDRLQHEDIEAASGR